MVFPLPRGFVRHFRAVIYIDVIEMIHGRHHRAVSGIIVSQFVGNHPAELTALTFEGRIDWR